MRRRPAGRSLLLASAALAVTAALSACSSVRETAPGTATEQLILSSAADRAVAELTLDFPPGSKVFLDVSHFEGTDSKYAIGAIRERLLTLGTRFVPERPDADIVVEVRSGALSMDEHQRLVGLPEYTIPIPLTGDLALPEMALFKRRQRLGVSKLAATSFGREDGRLVDSAQTLGLSHETEWTVLFFFSWKEDDLIREPDEEPGRVEWY